MSGTLVACSVNTACEVPDYPAASPFIEINFILGKRDCRLSLAVALWNLAVMKEVSFSLNGAIAA